VAASDSKEKVIKYIDARLDYLQGSRPTAVDLSNAIKLLKGKSRNAAAALTTTDPAAACAHVRQACIQGAEKILEDDLSTNLAIGRYGAEYLRRQHSPVTTLVDDTDQLRYYTTSPPGTQGLPPRTYRKLSVLTHCNTG
jgi:methylthioribose-1-phosphate isomerase